jgi:outer membrane protein assembly factor BamB
MSPGVLVAVRVADGKKLWRLGNNGQEFGPPAIDGDKLWLVVGGGLGIGGALECLRASDGHAVARIRDRDTVLGVYDGPPIVRGRKLYADDMGGVVCFDLETQRVDWHMRSGLMAASPSVWKGNAVYFLGWSLGKVDLDSGKPVWADSVRAEWTGAAVGDGRIYAQHNGVLTAFAEPTAEEIAKAVPGRPDYEAPMPGLPQGTAPTDLGKTLLDLHTIGEGGK